MLRVDMMEIDPVPSSDLGRLEALLQDVLEHNHHMTTPCGRDP